ncbi:hypothetical protein RJ639_022621 [Escallonia herrerae]|uniref:Uncharacterized protein n=1 Tax=Escallonia herrerae TaxID=1293975 RepID=A0AA88V0V5_9ASTE|nr:hypothetical protein RJ639_022730 [Escallonia herrerae]KAK2999888.1 hypothetical protein RJ639_022621 [Escallonia herrerae]
MTNYGAPNNFLKFSVSSSTALQNSRVATAGLTHEMEKAFTLIQTVATAGVFSAVSFWYGFMFGRESARKELSDLIDSLRRDNPDPSPPHP